MEHKIVVVGSCNIDNFTYTARFPKPQETMAGTSFLTNYGGKGANQAIACGKLGGNVSMVGRLGHDVMSDKYIEEFKLYGVDTTYLKKTDGIENGTATIIVDENGNNMIIIISGANGKMTVQDVNDAKDLITNAEVLMCQCEIPEEVTIAALQMCKGTTILNLSPVEVDFNPNLVTMATILCINEIEASVLSGIHVSSVEDAKQAIAALLQKGVNAVILTLGSQGLVYASKDEPTPVIISATVVKALDCTGAGDCFTGAVAYLLANRKDLPMAKILQLACRAATDSVTRLGAHSSYPGNEIFDEAIATATTADTSECSAKRPTKKSCKYVENVLKKASVSEGEPKVSVQMNENENVEN